MSSDLLLPISPTGQLDVRQIGEHLVIGFIALQNLDDGR